MAIWDGLEWGDLPGLQNFVGSVMTIAVKELVCFVCFFWGGDGGKKKGR